MRARRCSAGAVSTATWMASRSWLTSANGRDSHAASSGQVSLLNSGRRAATKPSRSISLSSLRETPAPSMRLTSSSDCVPTWKKSRLSRMAVIAPMDMPEETKICAHSGKAAATSGLKVTSMARPRAVVTMAALRPSAMLSLAMVCRPAHATLANSAREAPPSTGEGMAATMAAAFGSRPRMIMKPAAEAATQRDFTPVRRTSPTFCAKQV